MKYAKSATIFIVLSVFAAFSAGASVNWEDYIGPKLRVPSEEVRLFVDRNGCQYLVWYEPGYRKAAGSMIPRMRPDGKQECEQK